MGERKRNMSRTELFLHSDREGFQKKFGKKFTDDLASVLELREFFFGPHETCVNELKPKLRTLMLQHYPILKGAGHHALQEAMDSTNNYPPDHLMWQFRRLCRESKEGMVPAEKYPRLEEWRTFYCNPEKPDLLEDRHRVPICDKDDAEWEVKKKKENRIIRQLHKEQQQRWKEFYAIVQPALFEHYPAIGDLDGDYWVLVAAQFRDAYEVWKCNCEEVETTVEKDMPPESILWKYEDWAKLYRERYSRLA